MITFPWGVQKKKKKEFPEGWGGPFCEPILENPEGMGGNRENPFCGGYGYFLELHIVESKMILRLVDMETAVSKSS